MIGSNRLLIAGSAVAAMVGSALLNRAATRRAERATPPAGKFIEVDGVRLHYVERGQGPAVVLLHGNAVMLQDYVASGVLSAVAEDHRVLAFDRPGFGYSDRPRSTVWTPDAQARLIARALSKLGIGPAVVVGHSWGTLVALAMAVNHPEAVSGLVLLSGYYYGSLRPDVIGGSLPAVPIVGDLFAHTLAPLTGLVTGPLAIKASFAPAPVPLKFSAFPRALALRPSQIRATAAETAMMVPSAMALSKRYAELTARVIIMAGEGDLIVHPDKHAERLAAEVPASELLIVPGQGHMLHYAVPEQIASAVAKVSRLGLSTSLPRNSSLENDHATQN